MAAKRAAGAGGLSKKVGYNTGSDVQRLEYANWQATGGRGGRDMLTKRRTGLPTDLPTR